MKKDGAAVSANAASAGESVADLERNVLHVRNVLDAMEREFAADSRTFSELATNLRECEEDVMALLRSAQLLKVIQEQNAAFFER